MFHSKCWWRIARQIFVFALVKQAKKAHKSLLLFYLVFLFVQVSRISVRQTLCRLDIITINRIIEFDLIWL